MTSMPKCPPMPSLVFSPAPCPCCGAINEDEASRKCKPSQDQSGEYECPGEFNKEGRSIVASAESLAGMDSEIHG